MVKNRKPKKHPQEDYANHLVRYFSALTPEQRLVDDKLNNLREKSMATFSEKSDRTTAEINEYDRQRFGFTALSISLIVGALLSNQVSADDTLAARIFFVVSIAMALFCVLLLFLEYSIVFKFFKLSNDTTKDVMEYISSNEWKDSDELQQTVMSLQKRVPINSSRALQYSENVALALAFLFVMLWLIEVLFNPHWAFWVR